MNANRIEATGIVISGAALALLALGAPVDAQDVAALPDAADRAELIALIEAAGVEHPPAPADLEEPVYWSEVPGFGTSDRRCVDVPERGPVRSGDFRLTYGAIWPQAGRPHKIAWGPVNDSRSMRLRVRGWLVADPESSMEFASSRTARPSQPEDATIDDRWYFFPSMTLFPDSGEWVVVATSGANWGCFIFRVTAPGAQGIPHEEVMAQLRAMIPE